MQSFAILLAVILHLITCTPLPVSPINLLEPFVNEGESLLSKGASAFRPTLESIAERPEGSVFREMLVEGMNPGEKACTQGGVGACHAFATQVMMKDATGVDLSTSRLFLDHLMTSNKMGANPELAIDHNLNFVKNQNQLLKSGQISTVDASFGDWEGGNLIKNLEMLKSSGGVIRTAPEDQLQEWKQVERTIERLNRERDAQISGQTNWWSRPLTDEEARSRLQKAGVDDLISKAISPVDAITGRSIEEDRLAVMAISKNLEATPLRLAQENPRDMHKSTLDRATQLVHTLEKNAIYLGVEYKWYSQVAKGKHIPLSPLGFPNLHNADHAVVIAGYNHDTSKFLVLDSNFPKMLEIDSSDLVQTIATAYILKKI